MKKLILKLNSLHLFKLNLILISLFFVQCTELKKTENTVDSKQESVKETKAKPTIEVLSDEALQILDVTQPLKVEATGFDWIEGPLWINEGDGYLLFSDIPENKVYKLTADGKVSTFLEPSGFTGTNFQGREPGSNGLVLSPEGELILMQHGDRRIAKMNAPLANPSPTYSNIAATYEGKKLNSPNDAIYDKAGNLYFTDPPFGLPKWLDDPAKEVEFSGVYFLGKDGQLSVLDKEIGFPNGIGLSPDEKHLYVSEANPKNAVWYKYDLTAAGEVSNKRLIYDATALIDKEDYDGWPDGMDINSKGYIFGTGPGGVWILNPEGTPLARIRTERATANCTLTDDEKKLFITADDRVVSVVLK